MSMGQLGGVLRLEVGGEVKLARRFTRTGSDRINVQGLLPPYQSTVAPSTQHLFSSRRLLLNELIERNEVDSLQLTTLIDRTGQLLYPSHFVNHNLIPRINHHIFRYQLNIFHLINLIRDLLIWMCLNQDLDCTQHHFSPKTHDLNPCLLAPLQITNGSDCWVCTLAG